MMDETARWSWYVTGQQRIGTEPYPRVNRVVYTRVYPSAVRRAGLPVPDELIPTQRSGEDVRER